LLHQTCPTNLTNPSQAFFIGFSFYDSPNSIQGLRNQIFSIFLILTIFSNVQQLFAPKFIERRSLYEAVESRAKTYSWPVFVSSNILVELPWQLLISVALFAVWYYPVGLYKQEGDSSENERAVLMFLCLWAYMTFCSTFSAMLAAGMQHAQTAVEIAQLLYYLILIFCG
jgi:ATP-binding cassette subfamily G (WHITE) protein 2 (PDR)